MTDKQLMLSQLLDCWTLITGVPTKMIPSVERALYEFSKYYSKADLELTLNFIVRENRRAEKPWKLRFEKFFDNEFVHFESLRGEADLAQRTKAAKARAFKATAGQIALAEMRHEEVTPPETPAKRLSTEVVIEALRSAKQ